MHAYATSNFWPFDNHNNIMHNIIIIPCMHILYHNIIMYMYMSYA